MENNEQRLIKRVTNVSSINVTDRSIKTVVLKLLCRFLQFLGTCLKALNIFGLKMIVISGKPWL